MRFNTLDQWLAWQEQLHPSEIDLGLERISHVYQRLINDGQPQHHVITVGGTNGKGSTVAMLEAIYRAAGFRVGSYTSPHLLRYTERIRIDGEEIDEASLCAAFERVDQARGETSLSYFEFGTLAALDLFNRSGLDVVILEVGLGGRLDAVNIVDPDLALITNVGIDHQDWLGSDRESIAREKAGIMRPDTPVVFGEADMPQMITDEATRQGAKLYHFSRDYGYQKGENGWRWWSEQNSREALPLPAMRGEYQLQNAAGVLMAIECLKPRLAVSQADIRQGLLDAQVAGRFQIVPGQVATLLDVGHNPHAAEGLKQNLQSIETPGKTLAVVAMMADKAIDEVVQIIAPEVDHWFVGGLEIPRAAKPERVVGALQHAGVNPQNVERFDHIQQGYEAACQQAGPADRIVVFGSFYTVSAVMELLEQQKDEVSEGHSWNIIHSSNG